MAIQRATFNGNLNPQAQPDETVLDFLQKSRIAQQNQENQNAEQLNRNAEQGNLNAASALDLAKGNYDFDYTKQKGDIVHPMVLNGLKTAAQLNGTVKGASQPAQNLTSPLDNYAAAVRQKNVDSQSALDQESARLEIEKNLGPALSDPDMQAMETRSTQNEQATNENKGKLDDLSLTKALAPLRITALQEIATVKGNNLNRGDATKETAALADIRAKYPMLNHDPQFEDAIATKTPPATFNMNPNPGQITRAEVSAEGRIGGVNKAQSQSYEMVKDAALAFNQDYNTYNEAMATGNKQGMLHAQLGMLDKFITSSTRKATGEAQFLANTASPGILNSLDNMKDKVLNGSPLSQDQIETLHDLTMRTAEAMREKVQQTNAMTEKQVASENKSHNFTIDPSAIITHTPEMLTDDSTSFALPIKGLGKKTLTPQQQQLRGKYNY